MNTFGLVLGAFTFVLIGAFHVVVIKGEYYLSKNIWPLFLALGVMSLGYSLFSASDLESGLWAVWGMTFLWSIMELFQQEKRVEKVGSRTTPTVRIVTRINKSWGVFLLFCMKILPKHNFGDIVTINSIQNTREG